MKNKAAIALGKKGGKVKSAAKAISSKANGVKGGRPRKDKNWKGWPDGSNIGEVRYSVTAEELKTHKVTLCGPYGIRHRETNDMTTGEMIRIECDPPCFFRVLPNVQGEPDAQHPRQ
jgi:hypothetical protein